MAKKLITKKEYAELCGIALCTVTKHIKGRLKGAVDGQRIDFNHTSAQEYYNERTAPSMPGGLDPLFSEAMKHCNKVKIWTPHEIRKTFKISHQRAKKIFEQLQGREAPPEEEPQDDIGLVLEPEEGIDGMGDWTLNELISKFGTATKFYDWLKALKEIEAVTEKRIKNATNENRLISQELVQVGIIDQVDGAFVKMLTDATTTIAGRAYAMVKAGEDEKAVKDMVEDQLSSFIRPTKDRMRRAIEDFKK
jgi:hypothetical protein